MIYSFLTILTDLLLVAEGKFNRRASEAEFFAPAIFEIPLITPVNELEMRAVNYEPRRRDVGLDGVAEFRMRVFEAGRRVLACCRLEQVVQLPRRDFAVALGVDLRDEVEDFRDVLAGDGRGEDQWRPGCEVELRF